MVTCVENYGIFNVLKFSRNFVNNRFPLWAVPSGGGPELGMSLVPFPAVDRNLPSTGDACCLTASCPELQSAIWMGVLCLAHQSSRSSGNENRSSWSSSCSSSMGHRFQMKIVLGVPWIGCLGALLAVEAWLSKMYSFPCNMAEDAMKYTCNSTPDQLWTTFGFFLASAAKHLRHTACAQLAEDLPDVQIGVGAHIERS